jgi:hypothetical protein
MKDHGINWYGNQSAEEIQNLKESIQNNWYLFSVKCGNVLFLWNARNVS